MLLFFGIKYPLSWPLFGKNPEVCQNLICLFSAIEDPLG